MDVTDSCLNLRGEAPSAVDQEIRRASLESSSQQVNLLLQFGCDLQGLLDQRLQSSVLLGHNVAHKQLGCSKINSRPVLHWRNSVRLGSLARQACGMLCQASLCHGTGGVFETRAGRGSSPSGASMCSRNLSHPFAQASWRQTGHLLAGIATPFFPSVNAGNDSQGFALLIRQSCYGLH